MKIIKFLAVPTLFLPLCMNAMERSSLSSYSLDKYNRQFNNSSSSKDQQGNGTADSWIDLGSDTVEKNPNGSFTRQPSPANSADNDTLTTLLENENNVVPPRELEDALKKSNNRNNTENSVPFYKNPRVQIGTGIGIGGAGVIALCAWLVLKK